MPEASSEPEPSRQQNGNPVSLGRDIVGAMKRDPLMLAFMIVILLLFWMIKQSTDERRKVDHEMLTNVLAACLPAIKKE